MKRYILLILSAFILTGFGTASAQPGKPTAEQKEQFLLAKMKLIQQELDLSEEQTNKFMPIYRKYNNEMSDIFDKSLQKEQSMRKTTKQEASAVVNQRLDMKMDILKLQKRYYAKFGKVLTADQLLRFDGAERKIQFQIMKRHDHRHKGERPPRKPFAQPRQAKNAN